MTAAPVPESHPELGALADRLVGAGVTAGDLALTLRLARNVERLEAVLSQLEASAELIDDAKGIAKEAVGISIDRLGELERRGYFEFFREGAGVVDRIVTGFSPRDVQQLGDNVVLILETVKEMTQPEVMAMLRSTAAAVQEQQHKIEDGHESVPSLWSLVRQTRDPEIRVGLQRALSILRSMGREGHTPTEEKGDR